MFISSLFRVPFLSEIELGNAPPKELIAKNFKIDYEQYRETMDMSEFFKNGKEYLEMTRKKIEDLKTNVCYLLFKIKAINYKI